MHRLTLIAVFALPLAACGSNEVDDFFSAYDDVVHEVCTCADEVGSETYDSCILDATTGGDAFTEEDRACLRMAYDLYPNEIGPTVSCGSRAFEDVASCVRSRGCTAPDLDTCLNLDERLGVCPEVPDIDDPELASCFGD